MADNPLISLGTHILTFLGGLVGGRLTHWDKKRRMRKNLYRELGINYLRVRNAITDDTGQGYLMKLPGNIDTSYRDYALRDMDTFHEIRDYHTIHQFYKGLEHIRDASDIAPLIRAVEEFDTMYTGLAAMGQDTGKALVKYAPDYVHSHLVRAINELTVTGRPSLEKRHLPQTAEGSQ